MRLLPNLVAVALAAAMLAAATAKPSDGLSAGAGSAAASNATLNALFAADQAARGVGGDGGFLMASEDRRRRQVVRRLLDEGAIHTGDDYFRAAFIFQHGEEADDFLLAHALAVTAVAKGRSDANWIAAATLDRYLQAIGQPQIYGTQFQVRLDGSPATQGDYDRFLIPDAARIAAGVPTLAQQEEQYQDVQARRRPG